MFLKFLKREGTLENTVGCASALILDFISSGNNFTDLWAFRHVHLRMVIGLQYYLLCSNNSNNNYDLSCQNSSMIS